MKKLPSIYKILTNAILDYEDREFFIGDLEELYNIKMESGGILISHLWIMFHFIISVPPIVIDNIIWSIDMISNFFKMAFRNIKKHRTFSLLNISGLSIGMACSIMLILYVFNENSYDKFHKNHEQIYRVAVNAIIGDTEIGQVWTPSILTPTLLQNYPDVEYSLRFQNNSKGIPVTYNEKSFSEKNVTMVDAEIFDVFTIPFIAGDSSTALVEPNSVVISRSIANKYFGTDDPMGKTILIRDMSCKITGIVKDLPENSHFHFNMFVSINSTDRAATELGWFNNNWKTYIKLKKGVSPEAFSLKLEEIVDEYLFEGTDKYQEWAAKGNLWEYYLQPLSEIHLNSDLNGEFEQNGNADYVSMFIIIAIFIIIISSFNYMNLSTARLSGRAREVGIRKVVGSTKSLLVKQFLSESVTTSLISLVIAILIVHMLIPLFSDMVGVYNINIPYYNNFLFLSGLIGFAIIIGILSGTYPAFYLSSIKSIAALSGKRKIGSGKWLRNGLVLLQFAMSIFLFIGTFVVREQLEYTQNKNLGFSKEEVLVIKGAQVLKEKNEVFKKLLMNNPSINSVTGATNLPGTGYNNIGFGAEGQDQNITLNILIGDYDYIETLELEMAAGRFYSREFPSDTNSIVINETTAKLLGWEEPLKMHMYANDKEYPVIGVVKDFHYESLHQSIRPSAIMYRAGWFKWYERYIAVKLNTQNLNETIQFIQNKWKEFSPTIPFEYSFLDEEYAGLYNNEQRTNNIATTFSFLAIFIACLGLFGLVAFAAELKTKEIGIRKVLGASVSKLVLILAKEFASWVILANIIAWPISYLAMDHWLQNFAYRIDIGVGVFLLSGSAALTIAMLTVSYQSIKSAMANPVDSLKYE